MSILTETFLEFIKDFEKETEEKNIKDFFEKTIIESLETFNTMLKENTLNNFIEEKLLNKLTKIYTENYEEEEESYIDSDDLFTDVENEESVVDKYRKVLIQLREKNDIDSLVLTDDESEEESEDDNDKKGCQYCDMLKDVDDVNYIFIMGYGCDDICNECIENHHEYCEGCENIRRNGEEMSSWGVKEYCEGCISWCEDFKQIYGENKRGHLYYEKEDGDVYDVNGEEVDTDNWRNPITKHKDYEEPEEEKEEYSCENCGEKLEEDETFNCGNWHCSGKMCEDCYIENRYAMEDKLRGECGIQLDELREDYEEYKKEEKDEEKLTNKLKELCEEYEFELTDCEDKSILDEEYLYDEKCEIGEDPWCNNH